MTHLTQHLEILQQTYCSDNLPSAFTITQYLRGELFVLIHSLLSREDVKEEDSSEAMAFLIGFLGFAFKMAQRVKQIASEVSSFQRSILKRYTLARAPTYATKK